MRFNSKRFASPAPLSSLSFEQQQIACLVPMRVIQGLEPVQVKEHQCAMTATALAGGHGQAQAVKQQSSVWQIGEGIVECQLMHLVFQAFALRDFTSDAVISDNLALRIALGLRQDLTP